MISLTELVGAVIDETQSDIHGARRTRVATDPTSARHVRRVDCTFQRQ